MFDKVLVLAHGHQLFFGAPSDCMRFFTKCSRSLRLVSRSQLDLKLSAALEQQMSSRRLITDHTAVAATEKTSAVTNLPAPSVFAVASSEAALPAEICTPDQLIDVVAFLQPNHSEKLAAAFKHFRPSKQGDRLSIVSEAEVTTDDGKEALLIASPSTDSAHAHAPTSSSAESALTLMASPEPQQSGAATAANAGGAKSKLDRAQASFCTRLWVLLVRNCQATVRNPGNFYARLGVNVFLAVIGGALFFNLVDAQSSIFTRMSVAYVLVLTSNLLPFCHISLFVDNRLFFNRERRCKLYNTLEYYAAAMIVETLTVVVVSFIFYIIFHFMAGLDGAFGVGALVFVLSYLIGDVELIMISNVVCNIDVTFALGAGTVAIGMFYSGLLVRLPTIPAATGWFHHVHWMHYELQTLIINEVVDVSFPCDLPAAQCLPPGQAGRLFVDNWGLLEGFDDKWVGVGIMCAYWVAFHSGSFLALKFLWRERS